LGSTNVVLPPDAALCANTGIRRIVVVERRISADAIIT